VLNTAIQVQSAIDTRADICADIFAARKSFCTGALPNSRTVTRVGQRNGLTAPHVRLTPLLPRKEYPSCQVGASNKVYEVNLVGRRAR
jgi:hypothetical protein